MDFYKFQKDLRNKIMPSGDELAKKAQEKFVLDKSKVEKNFNQYLRQLLNLEFKIYQDYEKKCSFRIMNQAIKDKVLKSSKSNTFLNVFRQNYNEIERFFLSISQSRKTRAGGSFEKHVRSLFELLNYPFDTQTILNGKVDYVIPSEKAFKLDRTRCVVISIKRTLRERWRQVVGELASTRAGKIYLLTIDNDLSQKKTKEIASHNITIVTMDELKKSKFKDTPRIIGFTEFVKTDLPVSRHLWKMLVKK